MKDFSAQLGLRDFFIRTITDRERHSYTNQMRSRRHSSTPMKEGSLQGFCVLPSRETKWNQCPTGIIPSHSQVTWCCTNLISSTPLFILRTRERHSRASRPWKVKIIHWKQTAALFSPFLLCSLSENAKKTLPKNYSTKIIEVKK